MPTRRLCVAVPVRYTPKYFRTSLLSVWNGAFTFIMIFDWVICEEEAMKHEEKQLEDKIWILMQWGNAKIELIVEIYWNKTNICNVNQSLLRKRKWKLSLSRPGGTLCPLYQNQRISSKRLGVWSFCFMTFLSGKLPFRNFSSTNQPSCTYMLPWQPCNFSA